jgi:hypothetical protein
MKYLAQISEKKRDDGVIGYFKNKLTFKNEKLLEESNVSISQVNFSESMNQKNIEKLLSEQVEMTSKVKKKYQNELEALKKESQEFRQQYAKQMKEVVSRLENVLNTNLKQCEDTFSKFYRYCNHKSKSENKIVNNNEHELNTMNIKN